MKDYLKGFGKGLLIGLVLNIVLALGFSFLLPVLHSNLFKSGFLETFFWTLRAMFLFVTSAGTFPSFGIIFSLLVFGALFVTYNRLGGKKPVFVVSVVAATIAIISWGVHFMAIVVNPNLSLDSSLFYLQAVAFLALSFLLGLIVFLVKIAKENKWVVASTLIWFLIALSYYLFLAMVLLAGP